MILYDADDDDSNDPDDMSEDFHFGLVVDRVNKTYQPMRIEEGPGSEGFYWDSSSNYYGLALGYSGSLNNNFWGKSRSSLRS